MQELATHLKAQGDREAGERYEAQARDAHRQSDAVRGVLIERDLLTAAKD